MYFHIILPFYFSCFVLFSSVYNLFVLLARKVTFIHFIHLNFKS